MNRSTLIAYVDLFGVLIAVLALLVANLAFPQDDPTDPAASAVIITVVWPSDRDADVDTWVRGPDGGPVGYSRRHSRTFNLLRDDLGSAGDSTGLNYEMAISHGVPPGEYVVNVHIYGDRGSGMIPIHVTAQLQTGAGLRTLWTYNVSAGLGQELTVYRFTLSASMDVTATSRVPVAIRNQPK